MELNRYIDTCNDFYIQQRKYSLCMSFGAVHSFVTIIKGNNKGLHKIARALENKLCIRIPK